MELETVYTLLSCVMAVDGFARLLSFNDGERPLDSIKSDGSVHNRSTKPASYFPFGASGIQHFASSVVPFARYVTDASLLASRVIGLVHNDFCPARGKT